ncbi:MAG TPA: hypothetical protein VEZ41_07075 [Allosphingosinicella sp.]|nr:hypothetical protein [Allosphingosinicella sp.]
MFLTPLLASLFAAQPPVAPAQAALAQCLGQFVATRPGGSAEEFASAFANACLAEERAYRSAYVAAATARGTPFLDADSRAYSTALDLRIAQRAAYLAANTSCRRPAPR